MDETDSQLHIVRFVHFNLHFSCVPFFMCVCECSKCKALSNHSVSMKKEHKIENISNDLWFAINLNKLILFVLSVSCAVPWIILDANRNERDLYGTHEKRRRIGSFWLIVCLEPLASFVFFCTSTCKSAYARHSMPRHRQWFFISIYLFQRNERQKLCLLKDWMTCMYTVPLCVHCLKRSFCQWHHHQPKRSLFSFEAEKNVFYYFGTVITKPRNPHEQSAKVPRDAHKLNPNKMLHVLQSHASQLNVCMQTISLHNTSYEISPKNVINSSLKYCDWSQQTIT